MYGLYQVIQVLFSAGSTGWSRHRHLKPQASKFPPFARPSDGPFRRHLRFQDINKRSLKVKEEDKLKNKLKTLEKKKKPQLKHLQLIQLDLTASVHPRFPLFPPFSIFSDYPSSGFCCFHLTHSIWPPSYVKISNHIRSCAYCGFPPSATITAFNIVDRFLLSALRYREQFPILAIVC